MKITLLCFGKLKAPGLRQYSEHLTKQIQKRFTEIELKPSSDSKLEFKQLREILDENKKKFSKHFIIALDEKGEPLSTQEWVNLFEELQRDGVQNLFLCIGGANGHSQALLHTANNTLSLGAQTLSHELARIVATEQVYRALKCLEGHPYHRP